MQDRRSAERRDLVYYLRAFDWRSEQLLGFVANISTQGAMLIGEEPIEPNKTYHFKMDLPVDIQGMRHIELEATSRWCKIDSSKRFYSTGFELSSTRSDGIDAIWQHCSNLELRRGETIATKRLFDILASLSGLVLLSPVFLLIGLITKLTSPGTVFYAASRVGKFGRLFDMYKFRTMNESLQGDGPRITAHDDPRITRTGRFLRQTKLNELPQLVNVLKGDMSLVGPRPEDPEFVVHYTPEQREVLSVQPGITSLASIIFAGEEKLLNFSDVSEKYLTSILPDKLQLDLLYVQNRSLLLDMDILVQTMRVLIPRFRRAAPQVDDILMGPFRMARRTLSWFAIDAGIALFSIGLAGALWRSAVPIDIGPGRSLIAALLITALFSMMNWLTGVQRIQWRYASPSEATAVAASAAATSVFVLIANSILQPHGFPPQMLMVAGILALSGFLVARYWRRLLQGLPRRIENLYSATIVQQERVLVVGAGYAGQLTISLLRNNPADRTFHVIGVVDDDFDLLGALVHRVPVLGTCDRIPDVVREKDVDTIVFAIHGIDDSRKQDLLSSCRETGARTVMVPDLLRSLRESGPHEDDIRATSSEIFDSSQSASSYGGKSVDFRLKIQELAKQAREGDTASVVRGLSKLDKELEEAEAVNLVGPPKQSAPSSNPRNQVSPSG